MKKNLIILAGVLVVLFLIRGGYQSKQDKKEDNKANETKTTEVMEKKAVGKKETTEKAKVEKEETVMEKEICSSNDQCPGGICFEKECVSGIVEGGIMIKEDGTQIPPKFLREAEGDFVLSAEIFNKGQVQLTWKAPENLNESNRFIIVRSENENPEHSNLNSWIRQSHLIRTALWNDIPPGNWHFRVCLTENNEKDTCTKYSNDVLLTVE